MWRITLYYKSDIKGVYTREEETVTDARMLIMKQRRMLIRWVKILIPELSESTFEDYPEFVLNGLIQQKIDELNKKQPGKQKRQFHMKAESIPKLKSNVEVTIDPLNDNIFELLSNYDADDEEESISHPF